MSDQLSYAILDEYFAFLPQNDQGISMTGMFLRYLADTGGCAAGLSWYFHYHHEAWLLCPRDLTLEQHARIEAYRMESGMFPLDKYQEASGSYPAELKGLGYQSTVLIHSQRVFRLLFVFLEMGHLGYHKTVADVCP